MPRLPPPEEYRWKPGQSGNPGGYSGGRRITDALVRLIEEKGATDALAMTMLACALGDTKVLNGRTPDYRFFKELLDRVDGPPQARVDPTTAPPRLILPAIDDRGEPPDGS